jgi:sigma-B regulation protein RsbU (phosphoserine phosphatase)
MFVQAANRRMKFIDLSSSSRISSLMDLTRALRDCRTPYDALLMYCKYLGSAYSSRAQIILSTRGMPTGQYKIWRLLDDLGTEHFELTNPWIGLDQPILSGGVLARIVDDPLPHLVHDIDWSDDPHFAKMLAPYHSLIAVPLFNETLPLNWSIMLARDPEQFDAADLETSVNRAALMGSLLDSLYIGRELVKANTYIQAELQRMAQIQRSLLPDPIPEIPGLQVAASYETFTQVGGDLYDLFALDKAGGRWGIFIGDASGHGPAAAVAAAMVQATLRACSADAVNPARLMRTLNQHLCQKRIEGAFVTAFLGIYEPATRRLTYSSAGHPAPMIPSFTDQPAVSLDQAGGLPLGIDEDADFDQATIQLQPGQTLVLYTDGISEARSRDGEMLGSAGIEQSLRGFSGAPHSVTDQICRFVVNHHGGQRPDDDQTIVVMQCIGE